MSYPQYLSPHFSFSEMTRTDNRRFLEKNRQPPIELIPAGIALCTTLLEPIREHFKAPLIVHSAYRCPELNTAIKGSPTSQHRLLEACDFHLHGVDMTETWEWIWKESGLKFGQLLLEGFSQSYPHPGWIHISLGAPFRDSKKCGQVMTYHIATNKYTTVDIVK